MISSLKTAGVLLTGTLLLAACSPAAEETNVQPSAPSAQNETATQPIEPDSMAPQVGSQNIVEVAQSAGSFNTLIAAAQAAGLAETLSTAELTVFAPTDEAFAKLPDGTVQSLLEDPEQLAEILKYHVVAGTVTAADVVNLTSATTLQGGHLTIDSSSGVKVNDAMVITPDVMASNGVIHIIDTVLLPK